MFLKKTEKRISQLHTALVQSFGNVKNDTNMIFQWLNFFYQKDLQNNELIRSLREELSYFPRSKRELRRLLDEYYSHEPILKQFRELSRELEDLKSSKEKESDLILPKVHELNLKIESARNEILKEKNSLLETVRELNDDWESAKKDIEYEKESLSGDFREIRDKINFEKDERLKDNESIKESIRRANETIESLYFKNRDLRRDFTGSFDKLREELDSERRKQAQDREALSSKIAEIDSKVSYLDSQRLSDSETLLHRFSELESRFEGLRKQELETEKSTSELDNMKQRLATLEEKKSKIKEKIIKRITKNSKEYVKTIILSYIRKYGKITALQLKDMVVEEQGLTSKSSFYRILEEIEELEDITTVRQGKEKHYLVKKLQMP